MTSKRPNTIQKAAKLFERYPHLKKFESRQIRKKEEPQQAEQESLVKIYSEDDKVPDFSKYTRIDVSKPGEASNVLDQSDDSLDNHRYDDSFDREDDQDLENNDIGFEAEKRKSKSVNIDNSHQDNTKAKNNNQNIQNYLESSMAINIVKPKGLEELKEDKSSSKVIESESDLSLCESSNSLNLRFYESSKEKGIFNRKLNYRKFRRR